MLEILCCELNNFKGLRCCPHHQQQTDYGCTKQRARSHCDPGTPLTVYRAIELVKTAVEGELKLSAWWDQQLETLQPGKSVRRLENSRTQLQLQ